MPTLDLQLLKQEKLIRLRAREAVSKTVEDIRAELFDKQLEVLDDPSREIACLCTRRAGKTSMWSRIATITAITKSRALIRIWAINRVRCKQLLWDELLLIAARHKINIEPNKTELTIRFDNGSEIRLLGADKDKEAQKKRGDKTTIEIVLESQLFGPYLKTLVNDVAGPCLFDLKGTFYLEGTPGPVCAGHWYEVSGRNDGASRWVSQGGKDGEGAGWSLHRWSVLDNPHLPHARNELAILKAKRRWTDNSPTYMREWLALWVNDFDALYYHFKESRNTFDAEKLQPWGPGWSHTLGWDLGFRDDMALVVWGWHPDYPDLYEAYSWKKPGALSAEVIGQIQALEARGFNLVKMVADTQGGGKMYVEDVMKRYPYAFEAAQKSAKADHVRLFNDELEGGFLRLQPGSPYALEICQLPTDPDWDPTVTQKPVTEDPRFANHCCDAGLYAWRAGMHFLHRDVKPPAEKGSAEWFRAQEVAIINAMKPKKPEGAWLNSYDDGEYPDDYAD